MLDWKKRVDVEATGSAPIQILNGLMKARGIDPFDISFLSSSLADLSDPMTLGEGASVAADLMIACKGKRAAVIGDYDADGIISSTLVKLTIEKLGGHCDVFLPSRWKHGYGLNEKTVKAFIARFSQNMPETLFIVDCGSSSEDYIIQLRKAGIKKIAVIDHHIINPEQESKSIEAHVNWRLCGTACDLCAAGEVFQVARLALMRAKLHWAWTLAFAAIATVGDSVAMTKDNRIIVKNGADYSKIQMSGSPGLCALALNRCQGGVSQKNLAFYVVPRINAIGRISAPDIALKFLIEKDPINASSLLDTIETANTNRKAIQEDIFKRGIAKIGGQDVEPPFVFLHEPDWNIGICGISCSQMVEKYGVPAMMFGTYEGKIKGSGRSVPGVNLKSILDQCGSDVFERYGGHEMACGATVRDGMFEEAKKRFGEILSKVLRGKPSVVVPVYDLDIKPESVTIELGNTLFEYLYPYCPDSNPEPVFRISQAKVTKIKLNKYKVYSKLEIEIEKDGKPVTLAMSKFLKIGVNDGIAGIKNGEIADFYFSFPQKTFYSSEFFKDQYILELVDIGRF